MKTNKIFTAFFTLLLFAAGAKAQESVTIHANEDPDNNGVYYTSFYDRQHAYFIPGGVTAYTAYLEDESVILRRVNGGILPKDEAVILRTFGTSEITMYVSEYDANKDIDNQLDGVDEDMDQDGSNYYMLSYGQNYLNFYKMNSEMKLKAHKAFIKRSSSKPYFAPALRVTFSDK